MKIVCDILITEVCKNRLCDISFQGTFIILPQNFVIIAIHIHSFFFTMWQGV